MINGKPEDKYKPRFGDFQLKLLIKEILGNTQRQKKSKAWVCDSSAILYPQLSFGGHQELRQANINITGFQAEIVLNWGKRENHISFQSFNYDIEPSTLISRMLFLVQKIIRGFFVVVVVLISAWWEDLCDLPDISFMEQEISSLQMGLDWAMGKMSSAVSILSPTNSIYLLELFNTR